MAACRASQRPRQARRAPHGCAAQLNAAKARPSPSRRARWAPGIPSVVDGAPRRRLSGRRKPPPRARRPLGQGASSASVSLWCFSAEPQTSCTQESGPGCHTLKWLASATEHVISITRGLMRAQRSHLAIAAQAAMRRSFAPARPRLLSQNMVQTRLQHSVPAATGPGVPDNAAG